MTWIYQADLARVKTNLNQR